MKLSIIISSELINIIVVVILVLSCLFEARRERPGVSWVMVSRQNLFLLLFLFPSPQKHEPDVLYTESFVLDSFSVCLFLNEIFVVKIALLTFFLSSDDLTFTLITFGYFCIFTLKNKNLFISVIVRNADINIFRCF